MLRLDSDKRAAIARAKAEIAEIMDPLKAAQRKERRQRERDMRKRVGKRAPGQRQPRERDNAYLAWCRRQCCVVGAITGWPCSGRIDPAHIRYSDARAGKTNPGAGNKPDDKWCLPVCRTHHDAQHNHGNEQKWWCAEVGADALDLARAVYGAFQAGAEITAALRRFAPSAPPPSIQEQEADRG